MRVLIYNNEKVLSLLDMDLQLVYLNVNFAEGEKIAEIDDTKWLTDYEVVNGELVIKDLTP